MQGLVASLLDALWRSPDAVVAALLLALPAFGLRCLLRARIDRRASAAIVIARIVAGLGGLVLGVALAPVGWASLAHARAPLIAAGLVSSLVLLSALLPSVRERSAWAAGLLPIVLVLVLAGLSALALLKAGCLLAATGETLVVAEVTGSSRREIVRFTPLGLPPREEGFRAQRLLLSRPDEVLVGETWIYGRAVTLHGEGLRLRPWGGGEVWLARFSTATNDPSLDKISLYPRQETTIEPLLRPALPSWWRSRQWSSLLALGLEPCALSTAALPLVDSHGLTLLASHRLIVRADGVVAP